MKRFFNDVKTVVIKFGFALKAALMAWAVMLLITGMPVISLQKNICVGTSWAIAAIVAVAVELYTGRENLLVEFIFDFVVGFVWFVLCEVTSDVEFIQNIGGAFSIPKMSILIGYIIIALFAQMEIRFKDTDAGTEAAK